MSKRAPASADPYPSGEQETADASSTNPGLGDDVTVTVHHVRPGEEADMYIESSPVHIGGPVTVPASATVSITGRIPLGYSGSHTILVSMPGGETFSFRRHCHRSDGDGLLARRRFAIKRGSGVGDVILDVR